MATGYFTFDADTIGEAPAGLTPMLNSSTATWTVQSDGDGGKCLRLTKTNTSDAAMGIDAIGDTAADVEIYGRVRTNHGNGTQGGVGLLMATETSTTTSAKNMVIYAQEPNNAKASTFRRIDTAGSTWASPPDYTFVLDSWYHFRIQRTGTGLRAKVWEDNASEPETWLSDSSTGTSTLTTGHVGPFARDTNGSKEWSFIGWGTDGDAAPTPVTGTQQLATPTNFTFTAHGSLRQLDGSWTAVSGAATYEYTVDYETTPDTWVALTSASIAGTSFQLTDTDGVDWGTTYRSRVRAHPTG